MPGYPPFTSPTIKGEVYASSGCVPTGPLEFTSDGGGGTFTAELDSLFVTFEWPSGIMTAVYKGYQTGGSPVPVCSDGARYCWSFVIDGGPCAPEGGTFAIGLFLYDGPPVCCPTCNCDCGCKGGGGGGNCGEPARGVETLTRNPNATCMVLNGPQAPVRTPDFSAGPIRYSTGEIMHQVSDLASGGFGIPWGHTRSFLSRHD